MQHKNLLWAAKENDGFFVQVDRREAIPDEDRLGEPPYWRRCQQPEWGRLTSAFIDKNKKNITRVSFGIVLAKHL